MKKCLFIFFFILSCENEQSNYNPYLPDISFERIINLSLPSYDNLNFTGGSVKIKLSSIKKPVMMPYKDILFFANN